MKKREFLSLSGALPLMLAGCGSGGGGNAQIRLLNASVGYTSLDLLVNSTSVTADGKVLYGQVSEYTTVGDGSQATIVTDTSTGTAVNLLSTTRTLTKDGKYTVIVYGYPGNPKTVQMTESQTAPVTGFASISVLNTSTDVGAVDVYLTTDGNIATATATVRNVTAVSQSAFASIGAGTYVLTVTAANNRTDVRLVSPGVVLADQQISTLLVVPGGSGVLARAIQLTNSSSVTAKLEGSISRIRLVPGLGDPGVGASLFVDGTNVTTLSSSPDIGAYLQVPSGVPTVQVNGTNVPVTLDASVTSGTLQPGSDYSMLVYGTAAAPIAKLVLDSNIRPLTSTNFKFRLVHLVDNQTDKDLTLQVASGVIANVHFGSASAAVETAAVGATTAQLLENVSVIYSQSAQTTAGYIYTMFAFENPDTGAIAANFWPDRGTT